MDNIQTFGEKAVGLSFNPGQREDVQKIKQGFAIIIDELHKNRTDTVDPEVKRMYSLAITDAQTAQMWAVKAMTY